MCRVLAVIALVLSLLAFTTSIYANAEVVDPSSSDEPPRLLTLQEIIDLPYGTKVWVEYDQDMCEELFGTSSPDMGMTRERTDKGEVIQNANDYWPLDNEWSFGVSHRVWTDRPTKSESNAIPWDESPWK